MAEAQQNPTSSFLIKIDKIRKKSYANSIFLKPDDVIVALNNQLYTFGEKRFVEELKDLKKSNERAVLTVLRNEIFIDIIIENSLGCGFITTDSNETEKIKDQFSKKNNSLVRFANSVRVVFWRGIAKIRDCVHSEICKQS